MAKLLLAGSSWQIPLAAVLGLIPNCVVSVVITQLYLEGALGFGATVAGLASAAGLGLLVYSAITVAGSIHFVLWACWLVSQWRVVWCWNWC